MPTRPEVDQERGGTRPVEFARDVRELAAIIECTDVEFLPPSKRDKLDQLGGREPLVLVLAADDMSQAIAERVAGKAQATVEPSQEFLLEKLSLLQAEISRLRITSEQNEQSWQEALVRQLEGTIKNDQGQIDSAKLNLTYCRITSPIGGRVGLRLVDPGNIVHATDANGLVVIAQLQPITVIFPIPEDSLPPVLARLKTEARLPVEAYDRARNPIAVLPPAGDRI